MQLTIKGKIHARDIAKNHLMTCKAKNEQCRNCGTIGHLIRMCERLKNATFRGTARFAYRRGLRRVNLFDQTTDRKKLRVGRGQCGAKIGWNRFSPFVLKRRINKQSFTTMITSGSPNTIFTKEEVRKILKSDVIFARPLPKNE